MRFDELIRDSMIIRDVKTRFPETRAVFESYGFRDACDDCTIQSVSRKQGLPPREVVDALNRAALQKS